MRSKLWLSIECLLLFAVLPFPLRYLFITPASELPVDLGGFEPRKFMFPLLWLVAIAAFYAWKRKHKPDRVFTKIPWSYCKQKVLPRFAISLVLMIIFAYVMDEARLFLFPFERTFLWLMILVFYPLISVVPQELVFRLFFFDRYAPLFGNGWLMIGVCGLAFGLAHIPFNNWIAFLLSVIGGVMFSMTYQRTRNLSLVWLEHAIYGQAIFTVGLGIYFYSRAAALHG